MRNRIAWLLLLSFAGIPSAVRAIDFNSDIRPLLSDRCIKCHGPGDQKGGLRLDSREAILDAIDLDDLAKSELIYRHTTDDEMNEMPPKKGGSKVDEVRATLISDRVNVTGQVWLGATMECAACHDHKFDPITHRDYYEMYAFFNQGVEEVAMLGTGMFRKKFIGATVEVPTGRENPEQAAKLQAEMDELKAQIAELRPVAAEPGNRQKLFKLQRRFKTLRGGVAELQPAVVHVLRDRETPPDTHIFERGSYQAPGEKVTTGILDALHTFPEEAPQNRLGLAQWLVAKENPQQTIRSTKGVANNSKNSVHPSSPIDAPSHEHPTTIPSQQSRHCHWRLSLHFPGQNR
ncbi:MAG: DUF1549 domain-containing protein [Verrucomicrobiota bacterium]